MNPDEIRRVLLDGVASFFGPEAAYRAPETFPSFWQAVLAVASAEPKGVAGINPDVALRAWFDLNKTDQRYFDEGEAAWICPNCDEVPCHVCVCLNDAESWAATFGDAV